MGNTPSAPDGYGATPLVCIMDAIPADQRSAHSALIAHLFRERVQRKTLLPDGYAYFFRADDFADVARFIENERRCCPFLTFSVHLAPAGPLVLQLTGPPETPAFLDAELGT